MHIIKGDSKTNLGRSFQGARVSDIHGARVNESNNSKSNTDDVKDTIKKMKSPFDL